MSDLPQDFDIAAFAPPRATLAMPKQTLERPGLMQQILAWLPGLAARPQG